MSNFDFNEWADLYQKDPKAFEQRRESELKNLISRASPENRQSLEQTYFKIRMTRLRSKTPLQSAIESSKLMWESVEKLRENSEKLSGLFNLLKLIDRDIKMTHKKDLSSAQVFQFKVSDKPDR
jgi:hypothetical protein